MLKKNRAGYLISETERECTKCGKIFKLTSKTVTLCNACNSDRVKSTHPKQKMWQRAKTRARERNIEFNLTLDDFDIPEYCPILGMKLEVFSGKSGGRPTSPALDRIDNSKGYITGNVMVISHLANQMKSSANKQQLQAFAKWVLVNYPEED